MAARGDLSEFVNKARFQHVVSSLSVTAASLETIKFMVDMSSGFSGLFYFLISCRNIN